MRAFLQFFDGSPEDAYRVVPGIAVSGADDSTDGALEPPPDVFWL
jgi:hypothetical protein